VLNPALQVTSDRACFPMRNLESLGKVIVPVLQLSFFVTFLPSSLIHRRLTGPRRALDLSGVAAAGSDSGAWLEDGDGARPRSDGRARRGGDGHDKLGVLPRPRCRNGVREAGRRCSRRLCQAACVPVPGVCRE
jgi:hypothetical protein